MNLLIAYDGSQSAEAAIADLANAGLPPVGEAVVVYVAEAWTPGTPWVFPMAEGLMLPEQDASRQVMDRAWQVAEHGARRLRELLPGWGVRPDAVAGPHAGTIIDLARTWPADMILLGRRERSGLSCLVYGSVSHKVLGHAPCSVRIARTHVTSGESPAGRGARILIGYDGSPHSQSAVRAVCSRDWPAGSDVRLIAAIDSQMFRVMPTYTTEGTLTGGGLAPLRRSVDEAVTTLEAARLRVTTCIEPGLPSRMLLEEAHRWPADVIFVRSRGLGPFARVLLGGVSLAVAEHAECSVEVVRPREIRPSGRLPNHMPTEVPHEVQAG